MSRPNCSQSSNSLRVNCSGETSNVTVSGALPNNWDFSTIDEGESNLMEREIIGPGRVKEFTSRRTMRLDATSKIVPNLPQGSQEHSVSNCYTKLLIYSQDNSSSNRKRKSEVSSPKLISSNKKMFTDDDEGAEKIGMPFKIAMHDEKNYVEPSTRASEKAKLMKKEHLNRREIIPTNDKHFACDVCGGKFNIDALLEHNATVHSDKRFCCGVCGKTYKWKHDLKLHSAHHSGESFTCTLCRFEFISIKRLKKHMKIH